MLAVRRLLCGVVLCALRACCVGRVRSVACCFVGPVSCGCSFVVFCGVSSCRRFVCCALAFACCVACVRAFVFCVLASAAGRPPFPPCLPAGAPPWGVLVLRPSAPSVSALCVVPCARPCFCLPCLWCPCGSVRVRLARRRCPRLVRSLPGALLLPARRLCGPVRARSCVRRCPRLARSPLWLVVSARPGRVVVVRSPGLFLAPGS